MKIILTAWLIYNGAVVPESITTRTFNTMVECQAFGKKLGYYFDGLRTYHTSEYVCTEKGVET